MALVLQTDKLELNLPTPPGSTKSDSTAPSSPSLSTSLHTSLPSTASLGSEATSVQTKADSREDVPSGPPSSPDRYGWLPYSAMPSPPALNLTSATAFFIGGTPQAAQLEGSESSLWADDEDEEEQTRVRVGLAVTTGVGGQTSSAEASSSCPPLAAIASSYDSSTTVIQLLSDALPAATSPTDNIPSLPFAFNQRRTSSLSISSRPRRRGAPIVYAEEDRICTCAPDYDSSSTTTTDGEQEEQVSVPVSAEMRVLPRRSLFLSGAMVRCSGL